MEDPRDTPTDPAPPIPAPERLTNVLTVTTPADVAAGLVQAWRDVFGKAPAKQSLLVVIAQSAFETGWWAKIHCWNFGNAKSREGDGHDYTYFPCTEYVNGKVQWFYPDNPTCRFRAFKTMRLGLIDYLVLLHNRFNKAWPAVEEGDPTKFVHMLKQQGYFTDIESHYLAQVESIARTLANRLAFFDPGAVPLGDEDQVQALAQVDISLSTLADEAFDLGSPRPPAVDDGDAWRNS